MPLIGPEGGSSNSLVYRPGSGLAGPVVFDTWPDLIAKLTALRGSANDGGSYVIMIDDSIASPATIPAGVYDMTKVTLAGRLDRPTSAVITEGVFFTQLRRITDQLRIDFTGAAPPVSDLATEDLFLMDTDAQVSCSGTGPFFRSTDTTPGEKMAFALLNGAGIGTGSTPAIDLAAAGVQIGVFGLAASRLEPNTVMGVVGSMLTLEINATASFLSEDQPAFAGTRDIKSNSISRQYPTPVLTVATFVEPNVVARVDSMIAAIAITLPPAFNNRGVSIVVKDVGNNASANNVTVLPSAGDTIDGGPSQVLNVDRGSLTLTSDGVSDWMITARA
jgi:hypothetical protein